MKTTRAAISLLVLVAAVSVLLGAQQSSSVPVDTQMTLDAAPTVQKALIPEVRYLKCPKTNMKGTGFLISTGVVITAAHVVCGCEASDMAATVPLSGNDETFKSIVRDYDLDIAALIPKEPMRGGLELASDEKVALGERLNTWGYPLIYNGPAPILSVGYASGYTEAPELNECDPQHAKKLKVKHIIVNGAFNPGNSGGPVFIYGQSKVVGIVVWKSIAFSSLVKTAIDGFNSKSGVSLSGRFIETLPDGTQRSISDNEMISRVLEEFYTRVQVNVGEAVSVSELHKFLRDHSSELPAVH